MRSQGVRQKSRIGKLAVQILMQNDSRIYSTQFCLIWDSSKNSLWQSFVRRNSLRLVLISTAYMSWTRSHSQSRKWSTAVIWHLSYSFVQVFPCGCTRFRLMRPFPSWRYARKKIRHVPLNTILPYTSFTDSFPTRLYIKYQPLSTYLASHFQIHSWIHTWADRT